MRKLMIATAVVCVSIGIASLHNGGTLSAATPPSNYILRAWRMDGGEQNQYLGSLEGQTHENSTGILYNSLGSTSLRARISGLPAGTKLTLDWGRGGVLDKDEESWRLWHKDLDDFSRFCKSNKITFTYVIITD